MTLMTEDVSAWLPPAPRRSYTGVPIGHGLIAEAAAEPVEFARLIRHLEREHLVTDWHDTIPTEPAALDDTLTEREDDGIGAIVGAVLAIGITGAAVAAGLLIAKLI